MHGEAPYLGQNCITPYPRREIVRRIAWSIVQATVFRFSPRPCHHWRALLLKWFGAEIPFPDQVVVFPTVRVTFPWKLRLAPRSMIGRDVLIYNLATVSLARGANISQRVHLCAGTHDFTKWTMPLVTAPIIIGENVWIAADVFVGPGVTVGELAVIGARSVVVRDQPARMICAGHPCRPLKPRPEPGSLAS
jgi:putative colanic acid biosynthesis acetyltransferase WcaF